MTLRHTYVETLRAILGAGITDAGTFKDWMPIAQDKRAWDTLVSTWLTNQRKATFHTYGTHFLFGDPIYDQHA